MEPDDPGVKMGVGGTLPAWRYEVESSRPVHLGRYPMEEIKRVDEPTTLIIRGGNPPRAQTRRFLQTRGRRRSRRGGPTGAGAVSHETPVRVGYGPSHSKHGAATGKPYEVSTVTVAQDRQANANAIKALGYFLGADFVGICRAEPWMYYSHDDAVGAPIEAYHEYAVVMLIDQGFETMDGASGDDWISASQSMRAYLRGAEIAGVMAAQCRRLGFSARSHTNAHSEVIHNPAILMAGLGEVSRIGDTLLNPFIGPPLEIGRPDHRPAHGDRQADRLRPAGLLLAVSQMRARMPLQCHHVRAESDVQRLRDMEGGC